MRGGEKCLEAFCELFPDADLHTLLYVPAHVSPRIRSMRIATSWLDRLPAVTRYYRYLLPLFPGAIERVDLRGYDLILSSSHCVAKGVIPRGARHIAYIHSPMRYVWDQYGAYFGTDASWVTRAAMAVWRRYLQQWDLRSSSRVDFFIANSHNVANKIKNLYGRDAAVIYPPVEFERFFIRTTREPYYLIVSALVPYKRIDLAIDAFTRLKLPLKIVGDGPMRRRLENRAGPTIEFCGWVPDDALPELYASCQALVFPGEEDFGIVPLEAQASGRPVIAYRKGGVLETVLPMNAGPALLASGGKPTGIFFDDPSAESLAAAVRLFRLNRERFDPAAIRAHACAFSKERFVTETRGFIERCLARTVTER
jgi:glycosyltransferase involved in cell wall biosynthesis